MDKKERTRELIGAKKWWYLGRGGINMVGFLNSFHLWLRESDRAQEGWGVDPRRGGQRIRSGLCADNSEPDAGPNS